MAAAATDKLRKVARRWVGQIGSGGVADDTVTTIPLASTTDLPTDTGITLVIDRVDANGKETPTLEETIVGVVSASNIINAERGVEGTAQAHSAGSVVELLWSADTWNDAVDWALDEHAQDGDHDLATGISVVEINDTSGNEEVKFTATASAVNEFTIANAATGNGPELQATGGDTNIDIELKPKGTGDVTSNGTSVFTDSIYRQAIINGNFDVWQRGTSFTSQNLILNGYTSDRWHLYRSTGAAEVTLSQQTASLNGSLYSCRVQRDNTKSTTQDIFLTQSLETKDSIKLRGQKLTLSFWAKCGANYSAASSYLVPNIISGTGTDENALAGFTGAVTEATANKVLTTSWQKFTITTTNVIADTKTQLAVSFLFTPVGTADANDWFEITQVQLCAGDVALPFMPKSYEEELRACQRYCYVPETSNTTPYVASGVGISATRADVFIRPPVTMRTVPSLTATAGDWKLADVSNAPVDVTAIAVVANNMSADLVRLKCTTASGLTQYRPFYLLADGTANRLLILSAEL